MFTNEFKLTKEDLEICAKSGLTESQYMEAMEKYAGPYDKISTFDVNDSDEHKLETLTKSCAACGCVFVTGVYHTRPEGTQEHMESYEKIIAFLRLKVATRITEKAYVIYLGPKDSKAPHPKILKGLLDGKLTLEGGLVIPGYLQPAAVTIITPGEPEMVTGVMGSATSNFHAFQEADLTPESMGCHGLPEQLMRYPLHSAEQMIHWIKASAPHFFETMRQADTETLCAEVFEALKTEKDCKKQKKLGRATKPNTKWFALSDTINPKVMALNLILRMACGDANLARFMQINKMYKNRVVEAAIHGPEESFTGDARDLVWGSMGGSAQVCFKPDALVGKDDKIKGFFGQGVALAGLAMDGDKETLASLGLAEAVTKENMRASAARTLEKIWADIEAAA